MDRIKLFGGGFPLTTDRFNFLQDISEKAISQLCNVVGEGNVIISGVQNVGGVISGGVVVIDKEVLEFRGGTYNANVGVFEEVVSSVPYNEDADNDGNLDVKVSDVVRYAKCDPSGVHSFSGLKRIGNMQTLQVPVGSIIPFDGDINNIPAGWELYDMANKFLMGAGGDSEAGDEGGVNGYTLTRDQMPDYQISGRTGSGGGHTHTYRDSYFVDSFVPAQASWTGWGAESVGAGMHGSASTDGDNSRLWYRTGQTEYEPNHDHGFLAQIGGGGQPIDNRPEFRALNFIRFVGF